MTGTVHGLGIGPGDPDLITVKALRILRQVPVIAYPAAEGADSLVRRIAAPHLPGGQEEIVISTPITIERFPAQPAYDAGAEEIGRQLDAGRDVAVLCEGDPFFYGSFMYLFARLAGRYPVEVVPGVTSLTACAAALGTPLAARNDGLTILPAPLPAPRLRARLMETEAAAIVKLGRHFDKVREIVRELGLMERAKYIERATLENQRILPLAEVADGAAPYFSMILVHRRGDAWL
ncbi:MAG: precorrin-2 C(20)-methyltransferase [Alphaproteobacteria bacterium]|jgi:precorrin-2/cobalt-factor-2 C20-methyltransferase|nr:precorrin-2 C(20)-methyltransferase [Alphaproteobacteria bacterium]MDP6565071.1 precorrin-2 C(20)-methyltransferase [Alphaproteobacteria bacterium]MDP6814785.1 precorrin-2 C(20)-methyltransferase [Alphaproteobacteria bacterium]